MAGQPKNRKEIVFLIKCMYSGGAERVMSMLADACAARGRETSLILTHQSLADANLSRLSDKVRVLSLEDELAREQTNEAGAAAEILCARALGKLPAKLAPGAADRSSILKYRARNHASVRWLQGYFAAHPNASVVAFLYDSIFLTLLAARKTNRVIISDRGDPQQSISSKTDMAFFRRMFPKADAMVFQSPGVRDWYMKNIGLDGEIIFNPVKDGLPQPFEGVRKKRIVNFCRLTAQKNLFLLLDSFERLSRDYPEYELHIYGDLDESEREYGERFLRAVKHSPAAEKIKVFPARADIHEAVLDSAMFVSSSDFEGMSNSMLEAMAIGLPVICTDCPAGGARAVIRDHENGLLVPVKDAGALYRAMKELIEDPGLAERLSRGGREIRETQSCDGIINQWMEII